MLSKLFLLSLPFVLAAPTPKDKHGDITFYIPGKGACGQTSGENDMVVAIGASLFDSGDFCGKKLELAGEAGIVFLTVVDRCVGCKDTDLDVSPAAFEEAIGPKEIGRRRRTYGWHFDGDTDDELLASARQTGTNFTRKVTNPAQQVLIDVHNDIYSMVEHTIEQGITRFS
ncbi:expansin module family [Fusarium beomiforme]|uniref:Expansin module family n=1 Tax=Fusarium beomiforme TaxID=44412 RepID=A0A9P5AN53_9HYPO|nr:expansin module family [Fusarium beomiforme]